MGGQGIEGEPGLPQEEVGRGIVGAGAKGGGGITQYPVVVGVRDVQVAGTVKNHSCVGARYIKALFRETAVVGCIGGEGGLANHHVGLLQIVSLIKRIGVAQNSVVVRIDHVEIAFRV